MDYEVWKKASGVYFELLKKKVIDDEDELYSLYDEPSVRDGVRLLAEQSGTQIVETTKRIHLVAKASGSVFAANFTHLRSKYKDIENKKYFYAVSIIILTYLADLDRNQAAKVKARREGITFYALERAVSSLVEKWEDLLKDDDRFERRSGLAMREMVTLWKNMEPDTENSVRGNKRTRIGMIRTSLKLLEDEALIHIVDRDQVPKAFPTQELFDRLEYLYGDQDRYEAIKRLMEQEEEANA